MNFAKKVGGFQLFLYICPRMFNLNTENYGKRSSNGALER